MTYKGPAWSYEGHPNHYIHARLMKHLYDAEALIEAIKYEPEDLGVAMRQIERIAHKFKGYARRLPFSLMKEEQANV